MQILDNLTLKNLPRWWAAASERQKNFAIAVHVCGLTPPEVGTETPSVLSKDHSVSYKPWRLDESGDLKRSGQDVDFDSRSYCTFDEYWAPRYTEMHHLAFEVQEQIVKQYGENDFIAYLWGILDMPRTTGFWTRENFVHLEKLTRASADQRCQAALTVVLRAKEGETDE